MAVINLSPDLEDPERMTVAFRAATVSD